MARALRVSIRLVRRDCDVANALRDRGSFRIVEVSLGEGSSTHLVQVEDESALRGLRRVKVGKGLYLVTTPSCSACRALARQHGVVILGGRSEGQDAVVYDVVLPRVRLSEVLRGLEEEGLRPRVLSSSPYEEAELSQAQLAALLTAYRMGALCPDRRARLLDVARELGVSPATLTENLRKALYKVVSKYLADRGLTEGLDVCSGQGGLQQEDYNSHEGEGRGHDDS